MFIIKSQNLKISRGLKNLEVQIRGGGGGFRTSPKFRFPTIIIFVIFLAGGKIHQITLKRSMVISADIFAVLLRYF